MYINIASVYRRVILRPAPHETGEGCSLLYSLCFRWSVTSRCQYYAGYCHIGVLVSMSLWILCPGLSTAQVHPSSVQSTHWPVTMWSLCFPTCRKLCIAQHPHFPTDSDAGKLVTQWYFAHFYRRQTLCHILEFRSRIGIVFVAIL